MSELNQLIELIYDDDLVQPAEVLYAAGAVIELVNIEPNFYIGKVKDGRTYEIEIQSPFAKKQKMSCECNFFVKHNICKHTIAGLLSIRDQIKEKKEIKEVLGSKNDKKRSGTLNIAQILEGISHDDLVVFIKNYAKTDKKFSTQLKVNFARKIDLLDNVDKYRAILNTIVRPHTGQDARATSSDIRAILHVLEDFSDQINDSIALGQFREAFNIFESAFAKLEYIRHHYDYHMEQLTDLSKVYHHSILYFLEQKLPPELRVELNHFLLEMASRSYYHFTDINVNIVSMVITQYRANEKSVLLKLISDLMGSRSSREKTILLALYLKVAGRYTAEEATFLRSYSSFYIEVADHLLAGHAENLALKILESIYLPKKYEKELVNRLVFLYVRYKNTFKLAQTARLAYINSGDFKYMEILKRELSPEDYSDLITDMEFELTSTKADPNLLIRIYKKEERWSGLLTYLANLGSLDLLRNHEVFLYKYEREGFIDLYLSLISKYLDEYAGDSVFHYLESIKQHLSHQGLEILIQKLKQLLLIKYAHRPKLLVIFK